MEKDKPMYQEIYDDLLSICTTLIRENSEATYDFLAQRLLDIYTQLTPTADEILSFEDRAWLLYCQLLYKLAAILLVTSKPETIKMLKVPIEEIIRNAYSDYPIAIVQAEGAATALLWLIYSAHTLKGEKDIHHLSVSIASLIITKALSLVSQVYSSIINSSLPKEGETPSA